MRDAGAFDTDLYRAKLTLWVEDDLTRHFLARFWQDRDITIHTAGGKEILRHLRSHLPALDQITGRPASSSQRDEDLAKRLSGIMRTGSSPARDELRELRRALRGRAGLRVA